MTNPANPIERGAGTGFDQARAREEFPILERCVFFNHAAVAPLPRRAGEALRRFADEACAEGGAAWPRWAGRLRQAREAAGALLGTPADEVAFCHNTTHGLLCVANSIAWRPGDNVVTAAGEFPANVYPWRNLTERGVALRTVGQAAGDARARGRRFAVEDFAAAIDARTRLVAVSWVQYATGYRMPIAELAELCHTRGAWLCVDAIQGLGALPAGVGDLGCDFLCADGHKWLLGPEGIGLLWMRPELSERLNQSMTGWVGRPRPGDYDDTAQPPLAGARRFEEGSFNMAGALALSASLALLREVGAGAVWSRIEALTAQLAEGLKRLEFEIVSPRGEDERSGILVATRTGLDAAACARELESAGVYVVARRGGLRFSPHFYNTAEQVDQAIAALGDLMVG